MTRQYMISAVCSAGPITFLDHLSAEEALQRMAVLQKEGFGQLVLLDAETGLAVDASDVRSSEQNACRGKTK